MSNAPTCRNCQHAVWVMSPGGKQINFCGICWNKVRGSGNA